MASGLIYSVNLGVECLLCAGPRGTQPSGSRSFLDWGRGSEPPEEFRGASGNPTSSGHSTPLALCCAAPTLGHGAAPWKKPLLHFPRDSPRAETGAFKFGQLVLPPMAHKLDLKARPVLPPQSVFWGWATPPPLQCDQSKLAAGLRFVHEASPLHSLESFFCWHSKAAAHLRTPGGWSWHHLPGKDLSSSARFSSALCEALCRMSAVPENLVPVQGVRALDTDELTPLWLPPVPASIMESPSPLPPDHLLPPASGRAEWFPLIPYNLSP